MNVLLVVNSLAGGGAERVMSWLATALVDRGHHVRLIVRTAPESDTYTVGDKVAVIRDIPPTLRVSPNQTRLRRLPQSMWNRIVLLADYVSFCRQIRNQARDMNADAVLSFIDVMNVRVLVAMLGARRRVLVSERVDPQFHQLSHYEFVRPILYRRAACVVVQSQSVADRVAPEWHLSNVAVVPNPGPVPAQSPMPYADRPKRVLSAGRLHTQKDHAGLVKAWSLVGQARTGWELHIFGEGPERERIAATIAECGVGSSVHLRGYSNEVLDEYEQARIFVLPSRFEGFPNALVEAMARGCACVATDCPGSSAEILEYGASGVVVPTEDPEALASGLEKLMLDDLFAAQMGDAATRRVSDFDEELVYQQWERVLAAPQSPQE